MKTKFSKRQISIRSKTDLRTVNKFFKGEKILLMKELQIKNAIIEMEKELKAI